MWVRRFVRFREGRHPRSMGAVEVSAILMHLARARRLSASTQNQVLAALLFRCREVWCEPLAEKTNFLRRSGCTSCRRC